MENIILELRKGEKENIYGGEEQTGMAYYGYLQRGKY